MFLSCTETSKLRGRSLGNVMSGSAATTPTDRFLPKNLHSRVRSQLARIDQVELLKTIVEQLGGDGLPPALLPPNTTASGGVRPAWQLPPSCNRLH